MFAPQCEKSEEASEDSDDKEANRAPPTQQRLLLDAQKFQIMDEAVQPTLQQPVLVAEKERWGGMQSLYTL